MNTRTAVAIDPSLLAWALAGNGCILKWTFEE